MNKKQLVEELKKKLCCLSQNDIEKSIDYYCEMIDERMEEGLTEEQAVAAIGTADEIAEQILSCNTDEPANLSVSASESSFVVKENTNGEKTFTTEAIFENIDISCVEKDIHFYPSKDNKCAITYREIKHINVSITIEKGTLIYREKDDRNWSRHILCVNNSFIDVYLPEKEYENLKLLTVSGDITLDYKFTFKNADLQSTSGDIVLHSNISGKIYANTVSGDIDLENIRCNTLKLNTTSGDIDMSDVVSENTAALNSVSGDITFSNSDAADYSISTVSGDVDGNILTPKQYITSTVNGDVNVPNSASDAAGKCYISTVSGDIEILY